MQIAQLEALTEPYHAIYLSPHLDDAALSCGGQIAVQRAAGQRVLVITICTAAPDPAGPFSGLALAFHREWQLSPEQAVAARLSEDRAAMALLDADYFWAARLDAIYRQPSAYQSRATLFAAPSASDPLRHELAALLTQLAALQPQAHCYAPLGIGAHVDHQLTHHAALAWPGALSFYEDFPYVAKAGALEARQHALGAAYQPEVTAISGQLATKIAAVQAYASQLAELAQSQLGRPASPAEAAALMANALRDYAAQIDPLGLGVERTWRR